jgi:hypothetical protein
MVFEGGKVDQVAFQVKGRHLVTDLFRGMRGSGVDGTAQQLEFFLDISRKEGDVFIDRFQV